MAKDGHEFGSPGWIQAMWSSPPVDKIKGRTKWTQAHQPWCDHLSRHAALQGRPEYIGFLALTYLKKLGIIERFKEHPFATTEDDLGWEIRPDLGAEDRRQRLNVIEIKTARFVTPKVQMQLDANQKGLEKFDMRYLLWTDRYPLNRFVRHNLINMRRAASEDVADEEILGVAALTKSEGKIALGEVVNRGFDLNCILSAWWRGQIFLPLTQEVNARSMVSDHSAEDLEAIFLNQTSMTDDWWETLPAA